MKNTAALLLLGFSACCGSRNAVTQADMAAERTRPLMVYSTRQNMHVRPLQMWSVLPVAI